MTDTDSVPSIAEAAATGEIAEIYADIRSVLHTSVVNLIWRNLATLPGALHWTWSTLRPLYVAAAAPQVSPAPTQTEAPAPPARMVRRARLARRVLRARPE